MSVIPALIIQKVLGDLHHELQPLRQLYDPHVGLGSGLLSDDLLLNQPSLITPFRSGYLRSVRPQRYEQNSGISSIKDEETSFHVTLDVQQFRPQEISVKVSGGFLIVEAKHEERKDEHGTISRQFVRKYKLPENIIVDSVSSSISSDGLLSIVGPKVIPISGERKIPVVPTYQLAVRPDDAERRVVTSSQENDQQAEKN